ncbi:MAG TPA: hypothetical protein VKP13_07550, partial [Nitrospira sp.]|nr:hypothetical protein [Nitrospira sp.]
MAIASPFFCLAAAAGGDLRVAGGSAVRKFFEGDGTLIGGVSCGSTSSEIEEEEGEEATSPPPQ